MTQQLQVRQLKIKIRQRKIKGERKGLDPKTRFEIKVDPKGWVLKSQTFSPPKQDNT